MIKQSWYHLIFLKETPTSVKWHLYTETTPWFKLYLLNNNTYPSWHISCTWPLAPIGQYVSLFYTMYRWLGMVKIISEKYLTILFLSLWSPHSGSQWPWTSRWQVTCTLKQKCCHFDYKFSSLAALKVVILTTFSAASHENFRPANDENFVKMTTFSFQCMHKRSQILILWCQQRQGSL